jgi:magnesium-transporting ATPase (P-type)
MFWFLWSKLGWDLAYVRTLMFGFFALDTAFVIYSFKDLNRNIWEIDLFNNKMLNGASVFVILAFLATIYVPFLQVLIKTVEVDLKGWGILFGIVAMNIILIEATKYFFIVRRRRK